MSLKKKLEKDIASCIPSSNNYSFYMISDAKKLLEISDLWDELVDRCSHNPFFLSSYIANRMNLYREQGWSPLIFILSKDDELVGALPIRMANRFEVRFAKFLIEPHFCSDFIFDNRYREACIEESLKFLLRALNLHYIDLTLQSESPHLSILKAECRHQGVRFYESLGNAHQVLPIKYTWEKYLRTRGKKLKEFEYLERKLGRNGSWRIESYKNSEVGLGSFKRVCDIERRSWKEKWRAERGLPPDDHLPMVWGASKLAEKPVLDYDWSVYFLEFNGRDISYTIVLRYKSESVIMKTSYDENYGRFSPGKFVINAAVMDQFRDDRVKTIEFLTDLSFTRIWSTTSAPRVRMVMSNSRFLPKMVGWLSDSSFRGDVTISEFMHSLFNGQSFRRLIMNLREG